MQVKMTDHQHGTEQNDADNHHQDVGVARSGDEARQMMGGAWMKCFVHVVLHSKMDAMQRAETRTGSAFAGRLYLCTKLELGKLKLAAHLCNASKQAAASIIHYAPWAAGNSTRSSVRQ